MQAVNWKKPDLHNAIFQLFIIIIHHFLCHYDLVTKMDNLNLKFNSE